MKLDFLTKPDGQSECGIVQDALSAVRTHLGMEVAYLSEIVGDDWVVRAVDAPGLEELISPGSSRPAADVYCQSIAAGELPELIADTSQVPGTQAFEITKQVPIGAHVSIPIRRRDGSHYGNFCCLSPTPNPSLNQRDLDVMRSFAMLTQREVQSVLEAHALAAKTTGLLNEVMSSQSFNIVFQPIHELRGRKVSGFEALCRFHSEPYRSPDQWFDEAAGVGMNVDLEYCVLEATLGALQVLPEALYLSVNAGPDLAASGRLRDLFAAHDTRRLILEVTEHVAVSCEESLSTSLTDLRAMGCRIAVDDAGAGYSGLQQLLRLKPDIIKLDRSLVSDVDQDAAKRALCAAMVNYTTDTGSVLVAEGIEREAEASTLEALGVQRGQGWLLGRPMDLNAALVHAGVTVGTGIAAE